ncbi:MAG: Slp family lipoprotein [Syntrophales bacterium]|jgi:outer membrane lipoprotein|nr:Slp family lipoprotein [Syntrophales bacterium]MDY0045150.1 Slp family lipoprotein [Syntrophales bacterium]
MMKYRLVATCLAIIFIGACAPFSDELMHRIDEAATFNNVQASPEVYENKTVLWGGVIIETANRENETAIKIMKTNLDFEKQPTDTDNSEGRFIAVYPGFLDPAIYEKGRELTVIGTITGVETHPLGDIQYRYPIVTAQEIRLWEKQGAYRPVYDPFWPPAPFWWHRYPYWPYHRYW